MLAFCGIALKSESDKFIFSCIKPKAFLIDSSKREAAFPVGATNLMCNLQSNNSCRTSNKRVTVVVFPVPGPPVIIENGPLIAVATATFCQSVFSCFSGKYLSNF